MAEAQVDVLVIGGGPAGCAAAITLSERGLRVALCDRARPTYRYGEALAPAGATLLRRLGAWDRFRSGPHAPCYAYHALWGTTVPTRFDLLRSPGGPAWMIDRPSLVGALRERAASLGVTLLPRAGKATVAREATIWRVELEAERTSLLARWIIDASGRSGIVARKTGGRQAVSGKQVALIATLARGCESCSAPVLVEAVADGWWYSAMTPSGNVVLTYFTDRDLVDMRSAHETPGFLALLSQARATAERVAGIDSAMVGPVRVAAAHDSAINPVWGEGWVAAGDAALAYDPLSGHGITASLASGRDAGLAIAATLAGDTAALPKYAELLSRVHRQYRLRRLQQYAAERRWVERPYWARRTAASSLCEEGGMCLPARTVGLP